MEKKFIAILAGFILSITLFVIIGVLGLVKLGGGPLIPDDYVSQFVVIIPGPLLTDVLLFYIIPILFFCLFYYIAPYLIIFYIKVHQFIYWVLRRPSKYGIFKMGTTVTSGRLFFRALIVSFFSFSISALVVQLGYGDLFRADYKPLLVLNQAEAVFLGTFVLCAFMIVLFFPIWLLEDSGVVSYRVFHDERMPANIQGVHSMYNNILFGYAGLSTILALVNYIVKTLQVIKLNDPAVLTPIILIVLPFVVTGLLAIPIYLYEHFFLRDKERLLAKLARFNFPEIRISNFEEMRTNK
jgi:hypothetical protein